MEVFNCNIHLLLFLYITLNVILGPTTIGWLVLARVTWSIGNSIYDKSFTSWIIESSKDDDDYKFIVTVILPLGVLIGNRNCILHILIIKGIVKNNIYTNHKYIHLFTGRRSRCTVPD